MVCICSIVKNIYLNTYYYMKSITLVIMQIFNERTHMNTDVLV